MNRKPRVFVANEGSHNYKPAYKFGELVFCTKGDINKFATGDLFRQFASTLADSREEDFFMPTSLPILSAIACSILAYKHAQVRLLLFRAGEYIERTISLESL